MGRLLREREREKEREHRFHSDRTGDTGSWSLPPYNALYNVLASMHDFLARVRDPRCLRKILKSVYDVQGEVSSREQVGSSIVGLVRVRGMRDLAKDGDARSRES